MFRGRNPIITGIQAAVIAVFALAWMAFVVAANVAWIAALVWVVVKVLRVMGVL